MGDDVMTTKMLTRQNENLRNALSKARAAGEESESLLKVAQASLKAMENGLSVLDRTWSLLEEQLCKSVARLQDIGGSDDGPAPASILQLLRCPPNLAAEGSLDEEVERRMNKILRVAQMAIGAIERRRQDQLTMLAALESGGPSAAEELVAKLRQESERVEGMCETLRLQNGELQSQLSLSRDITTQVQAQYTELERQHRESKARVEQCLQELHRERVKSSSATPASIEVAAPSAPAAGSTAADTTQLARLQEEIEALKKTATERLDENLSVTQEVFRLKAALEEAQARPPSDAQLQAHPLYSSVLSQLRSLGAQFQVEKAAAESAKAELTQLRSSQYEDIRRTEAIRNAAHEEARAAAMRDAELIAQLRTDKASIELQLGQTALNCSSLAAKVDELGRVVVWCRSEVERTKQQLLRLSGVAQQLEGARDQALREKEAVIQQAHNLELELNQLRARFSSGSGPELSEVEKKCNDALVRLGIAEQRVLQAQQDLQTQKSESTALMSELDAISQAFEEQGEQNSRLMQQLAAKEEATTKLMVVRQKETHITETLKEENQKYSEQLALVPSWKEHANSVKQGLEQQVKASQDALIKADEERGRLEQIIELHKREAQEAKKVELQAAAQLKVMQEAEARSLERERVANTAAATSEAQVKLLTQERDALQRQLQHKRGLSESAGPIPSDVTEQLEYYRGIVKCPLCRVREKNSVIVKCCHTFCRECIDQRLNMRNRKCPTCGIGIDFQSVRELFLTS